MYATNIRRQGAGNQADPWWWSVRRRRWPVSGLAGVSGAGGSPEALRSPILRSIRFRPPRRRACFRLSLKHTPPVD
jgi:hypothetical protein